MKERILFFSRPGLQRRWALRTWTGLFFFSTAMGYLEASVVVYLRKIYYPQGFTFPLAALEHSLAVTEFWREVATLIMLAGVGILSGRTRAEKFAYFLYCFALWDLSYYLFLKILLDWPASLLDWDVLFLIPSPWIGPVAAPCLLSLTMVLLAVVLYRHRYTLPAPTVWLGLLAGSALVLASFLEDYLRFVYDVGNAVWSLSSHRNLFTEGAAYVPASFDWWLFGLGEGLLLFAVYLHYRRPHQGAITLVKAPTDPDDSFSDYFNAL